MNNFEKYFGKTPEDFEHLEALSYYNHNYYKGFDGDILYAESDDDNYTAWYLCDSNNIKDKSLYKMFSESFTSNGDVIQSAIENY